MPFNLQVIRGGDFIRLGAGGQVDLQGSSRVLAAIADEMVRRGLDRALLDVRAVENMLTLPELYSLAATFQKAGFRPEYRLAVVHRRNRIERADFFAECAVDRGWTVAAFDEYEDALNWLSTAYSVPLPAPGPAAAGRVAPDAHADSS